MLSKNTRIVFLCDRLGPYHHARFIALAGSVDLAVVEFSLSDETYSWDMIQGNADYRRATLFDDKPISMHSSKTIAKRILNVMNALTPDVVVIPGWDALASLGALQWCLDSETPTVLVSDSQEKDTPRVLWKEWIKTQIVSQCNASFVAGTRHKEYIAKLGHSRSQIFTGYDVVDNSYFSIGADQARRDALKRRSILGLPGNYFLKSSRFVEKKNLTRLIDAFAQYRRNGGPRAWDLVIVGDGPLRPQLEDQILKLGLDNHIHLPGFKQYDELPDYYGLAGAYIQASTTEQWGLVVNEAMASGLPVLVSDRCGCAPELVDEGVNGYLFDPFDVEGLAGLMAEITDDQAMLKKMGQESRKIIANFTPETFAENLLKAAKTATANPPPKTSWITRAVLKALIYK